MTYLLQVHVAQEPKEEGEGTRSIYHRSNMVNPPVTWSANDICCGIIIFYVFFMSNFTYVGLLLEIPSLSESVPISMK